MWAMMQAAIKQAARSYIKIWWPMKHGTLQAGQRCVARIVADAVIDCGASDGFLTDIRQRNIAE